MRILYHHRILAADGMQVHVREIVAALRRAGHEVALLGPEPGPSAAGGDGDGAGDGPGPGRGRGLAARVGALRGRLPAWAGELLELAYNLVAYPRLRREARAFAPAAIYERYNLFLLAGVWLKRALGVPLLLEVNAPLVHERGTYGRLALTPLARWAERYVWRRADVVLPVSEALAAHVRAAGVPAARIRVIPNGARCDVGSATAAAAGRALRSQLGLDGKVVVGFVGFIRPWHGLTRVLEVLARGGGELHLLVVGDGPARAELEARAAALGLDASLTITGAVPHDAVPGYLHAVDIALQPDVTPYASPLKLVEYMAAGRAIIAPDRPNIRECVQDGVSALLVDPETPGALEAAVARLAAEPATRARLGAAAATAVRRADRTWDGNAGRIVALTQAQNAQRREREAAAAILAVGLVLAALAGLSPGAGRAAEFACSDRESGRACPDLARLVAEAADGARLVLPPGDYVQCFRQPRGKRLELDFQGGRLHGRACAGKAAIVQTAALTLRNLECFDIAVPAGNGACVRHQSGPLTLDRVHVHDAQSGVLAGSGAGPLTIRDSRFERLGGTCPQQCGRAHAIYYAGPRLTIRNSVIADARDEAHLVKTGAAETVIVGSRLDETGGFGSRVIDAYNGGVLVIRDSRITARAGDGNHDVIGYDYEQRRDPAENRVAITGARIDCAGGPLLAGRGSLDAAAVTVTDTRLSDCVTP